MLPEGDQPGQPGIADPHVPVGLVNPDAVRDVAEVDGVERQPVEELAVVAVRGRDRNAPRQLGWRDEMLPNQDELADGTMGPNEEAAQYEGGRGEDGDEGGQGRPVCPGGERAG